MDNLPPLRALQIFDALGRSKSIAETARLLCISPGAVSQQLKILEQALGKSLTLKEGNRVRLNKAGQAYHLRCAQAFEQMRLAGMELEQQQQPIRISTLPSLMSQWLLPQILPWRKEHPELNLYLDGTHSEPSEHELEIDFRITYSERTLHAKSAKELFSDRVVPVCSPHLLKGRHLYDPADIADYPLLSIDWLPKFISPPSWQDWFNCYTQQAPQYCDSQLVFSLSSLAIEAAIAGHGFILAQYSMIQQALINKQLIIPFNLSLPLPYSYYLTWHKASFDKPQAQQVHRWLLAKAAEQREALVTFQG